MKEKFYINYTEKGSKYPVAMEQTSRKMLYLHKVKEDEEPQIETNKYEFNFKDYEKAFKELDIKGKQKHSILAKLENSYFNDNNDEEDETMKQLLKLVKEEENKKFKASEKLIPVLRKNWFDVVYINGGSGAGKTKYLVKMVNAYLQTLSKKEKPNVYLISKKSKDEMIDKGIKGIVRIDVDTFIDNPVSIDEVEEKSIVILDDFEGYENNKKLFSQIIGFLNDLMTMGRTKLFKIFIISHLPSFGRNSTLTFIEASIFVFFPTRTSMSSLQYILQNKVGYPQSEIKKFEGMKRVVVFKHPKMYISGKYLNFV